MSSKLNAESIGDWACTMANGIKGETARGEEESERGGGERESSPLRALWLQAACARLLLVSYSPIRQQMSARLLAPKKRGGGGGGVGTSASVTD